MSVDVKKHHSFVMWLLRHSHSPSKGCSLDTFGGSVESDCLGTELGHWPHCHLLLITFLGQIIPLLHFYVIPAWTLFVCPIAIKSTSSCSFPLLTPFPNPHFFILYFQQRNTGELEKGGLLP